MQCKELEAVLESGGLHSLPSEARAHLAGCSGCQDLLADLSAIVVAAKRLPREVTPPDRVWVSVRAQLELEGIIRDAEPVAAEGVPWWRGVTDFFRPRVLAGVGAGLLAVLAGSYLVEHRGTGHVAESRPASPAPVEVSQKPTIAPAPSDKQPAVRTAKPLEQPARVVAAAQGPRPSAALELRPSPSEDIYFGNSASVLDKTESSLPSRELTNNAAVDAALRQNLRTLNEFIAECQARLKQNPEDQLTREYLNMAYQQKAELLTSMLDSGRSEH